MGSASPPTLPSVATLLYAALAAAEFVRSDSKDAIVGVLYLLMAMEHSRHDH